MVIAVERRTAALEEEIRNLNRTIPTSLIREVNENALVEHRLTKWPGLEFRKGVQSWIT